MEGVAGRPIKAAQENKSCSLAPQTPNQNRAPKKMVPGNGKVVLLPTTCVCGCHGIRESQAISSKPQTDPERHQVRYPTAASLVTCNQAPATWRNASEGLGCTNASVLLTELADGGRPMVLAGPPLLRLLSEGGCARSNVPRLRKPGSGRAERRVAAACRSKAGATAGADRWS